MTMHVAFARAAAADAISESMREVPPLRATLLLTTNASHAAIPLPMRGLRGGGVLFAFVGSRRFSADRGDRRDAADARCQLTSSRDASASRGPLARFS